MDNNEEKTNARISGVLKEDMAYLNERLAVDMSFDLVYRVIRIGERDACMYFVDGFCKDELMQKLLQYFMSITKEDMPADAHEMSKRHIPYVEVDLKDSWDDILYGLLSGVFVLLIEGYTSAIMIDSRTGRKRGRTG